MSKLSTLEINAWNNIFYNELPVSNVRSTYTLIAEWMARHINSNHSYGETTVTLKMIPIADWAVAELRVKGWSLELLTYMAAYGLVNKALKCAPYVLWPKKTEIASVNRDGSIVFKFTL